MLTQSQKYAIATKISVSGNTESVARGCVDAELRAAAVAYGESILPLFKGRFDGYLNNAVAAATR